MVEVLKEEVEEGRSASLYLKAHSGEGKEKGVDIFRFCQFGCIRRTGRL